MGLYSAHYGTFEATSTASGGTSIIWESKEGMRENFRRAKVFLERYKNLSFLCLNHNLV